MKGGSPHVQRHEWGWSASERDDAVSVQTALLVPCRSVGPERLRFDSPLSCDRDVTLRGRSANAAKLADCEGLRVGPGGGGEELFDCDGGEGACEEESLSLVALFALERSELGGLFDAFGKGLDVECLAELDECVNECCGCR